MNSRLGRKKKNPPYFSHEFIISNHGDIVSVFTMIIVFGLLYKKFTRKLSLTKVRLAKFNESAHLAFFYTLSTIWAAYTVSTENYIFGLSSLWDDYPQRLFPYWIKMFFVIQELFPSRILQASMYSLSVAFAYIGGLPKLCMVLLVIHYSTDILFHIARALHLAEYTYISRFGFLIWNIMFIPVRMACIILAFLTLHYGLGKQTVTMVNVAEGNYNTVTIRFAAMIFLFIAQGLMVWNFITFHQKYQRGKSKSWFFGGSETVQKKKDKKKVKREDEDVNDVTELDQNSHKDVRKRKNFKPRS